ncbi:MAG: DUF554 domain-containing protein [Acidimicrobiia bacterium]|nr:DUF554 domain-containing protein [Acidimicrobiia bacterium]
MLVGTLTNVVTVIVGTAIGALAGRKIPGRFTETIMGALGLIVAALAVRETLSSDEFTILLVAVLVGALIGELLRIEQGLTKLGEVVQRRLVGAAAPIDVELPEGFDPATGSRKHRFAEGFVVASLVYLIGPLTILGSIKDGLGDPNDLFVKAGLDGFASIAFAAVYGWGVALSAGLILVIQGGIALFANALEGVLSDAMVDALEAAGGILLIGIALRLLDLKKIRVANMLPALIIAPLLVAIFVE